MRWSDSIAGSLQVAHWSFPCSRCAAPAPHLLFFFYLSFFSSSQIGGTGGSNGSRNEPGNSKAVKDRGISFRFGGAGGLVAGCYRGEAGR